MYHVPVVIKLVGDISFWSDRSNSGGVEGITSLSSSFLLREGDVLDIDKQKKSLNLT